jgi:23S rRNA (adenine2030-N6)-methyltransferase
MFSYRHAFHAGNHADVLKHLILLRVLRHLQAKDKPLWLIDTHAGAGAYAFDDSLIAGRDEYRSGIGRLAPLSDMPDDVADYVDAVQAFNPDGLLRHYPGSPALMAERLRPDDRLWLHELHPTDAALLRENFKRHRQVRVIEDDGFSGLKAHLPPQPRRALVLLDPPYEDKRDYRRLLDCLRDALVRFAQGSYLIWYPLVQKHEALNLPAQLERLGVDSWLQAELQVCAPPAGGHGLYGSGVWVINPPYTLRADLQISLPWLVRQLGQDRQATHRLRSRDR